LSSKATPATMDIHSPRDAGVLCPITSLPGICGIGDLGDCAYNFVKWLADAGQTWWQILPVGPVSSEQGYSPYSSWCSQAGNPLLISPEILYRKGLLKQSDLSKTKVFDTPKIDYQTVSQIKDPLLEKAFQRSNASEDVEFHRFCKEEKCWLDNFSNYTVLKKIYNGAPWYHWPEKHKSRSGKNLESLKTQYGNSIQFEQWKQFQFFEQWSQLKTYCAEQGIKILGDIPVYASYDSVDVWSQPHLFSLNPDGSLQGVAGVPPDYFNQEGQRWGMPVYNWEEHINEDFAWWKKRLASNLRFFDKVRIDHFRAFHSYWEIGADEPTAKNGVWKQGPGKTFFLSIQKNWKDLPFVVEDLGETDLGVEKLRRRFKFPGMKVLQFAFGENPGDSPHAPHHHSHDFVVYTGTHDNNNTLGWYKDELTRKGKASLNRYVGHRVNAKNINDTLIRMAYASVARTAIIPLQDLFNMDSEARMNRPGSRTGNWNWKIPKQMLQPELAKKLLDWTHLYKR